jgi:hypothetical protein
MEVKKSDLIIDEYGQYYSIIQSPQKNKLKLVNSFMWYSFSEQWGIDSIGLNYKGCYDGQRAMDKLKYRIDEISNKRVDAYIYNINDVKMEYDIEVIALYCKKPEVKKQF